MMVLSAPYSYMRGRLTLDKVNTAIDEMAMFAETNARLLGTQRKKVSDSWSISRTCWLHWNVSGDSLSNGVVVVDQASA